MASRWIAYLNDSKIEFRYWILKFEIEISNIVVDQKFAKLIEIRSVTLKSSRSIPQSRWYIEFRKMSFDVWKSFAKIICENHLRKSFVKIICENYLRKSFAKNICENHFRISFFENAYLQCSKTQLHHFEFEYIKLMCVCQVKDVECIGDLWHWHIEHDIQRRECAWLLQNYRFMNRSPCAWESPTDLV